MNRFVNVLILMLLFILLNCSGQDKKAKEQLDQYINKIETKLVTVEDDILALRERADNALTEERAKFNAQLDSLTRQKEKAEQKLEELKKATEENQGKIKSEVDTAIAKLDRIYDRARDW